MFISVGSVSVQVYLDIICVWFHIEALFVIEITFQAFEMSQGNDFLDLFHIMLVICHFVALFDILETKFDLHSFVKEYDLDVS